MKNSSLPSSGSVIRYGMNLRSFVALFVCAALVTMVHAEERLVLQSGFEQGVKVAKHPSYAQNHVLVGTDSSASHGWDQLAKQLDVLRFAYVIGGRRQNPNHYVTTRLLDGAGRKGTRGLLMAVKEDFPGDEYHTRNELSLFPKEGDSALFSRQGYARYWMKYDVDLAKKDWPMKWVNFFEVKERQVNGKENYRFNFRLNKEPDEERPCWGMVVHNYYDDDYEVVKLNRKIPVLIGKWFKVEAFWKRHATRGRLFLAVDGKVVFDHRGRTQHPSNPQPVRFWSPLKNYRHRTWHVGDQSVKVWYDDLELWTGFPPSKRRGANGK